MRVFNRSRRAFDPRRARKRLKRQLRNLNETTDTWEFLYIHFNTHEYTEEKLRSILSACNWAIPMNDTGNLTLVMIVFVTGTLTYLSHYLAEWSFWLYMLFLGGMVVWLLVIIYFGANRAAQYRMIADVVRHILDQRTHTSKSDFVNSYYSGANNGR